MPQDPADPPSTRPSLAFRYDFRAPTFGTPTADLLSAALDQIAYAESHGVERVRISEHHHTEDGYCPSPFVMAAAFAARTVHAIVRLSALVLPLHDPIRAAEDLAVVDQLSRGRLEVTVAAGYRPVEFQMFAVPYAERWDRLTTGVHILKRAWSGEPIAIGGRSVLVRPLPYRPGGPKILIGGAGPRAARAAAQIADGFDPAVPALLSQYVAACRELGREPDAVERKVGPFFVHVTTDPERDKARLAPHVQHELAMYSAWSAKAGQFGSHPDIGVDAVWDVGSHFVLTPAECVALVDSLDPAGTFALHPLAGGLPVDAANESVRLFCEEVIPHLGLHPAGQTQRNHA